MLTIDTKKNIPIYEQIIQQVKELCLKQIFQPNEKLPSVREMSSLMVVNPNTVSKAYKELERQGVIVTIRGKGTFIAEEPIIKASEKERTQLKESFRQLMIESHYLGIDKEELYKWLEEIFHEIGGEISDRS